MSNSLKSSKDILLQHDIIDRIQHDNKYISQEFQDYGLRLASRLNDLRHKALYINFAKNLPRGILEKAVQFAVDYPKIEARARIFMWKLKDLCKSSNIKMPSGHKRKKRNTQINLFK